MSVAVHDYKVGSSDLARLFSKVEFEPNTGCWLWDGATTPQGSGKFTIGPRGAKRWLIAHRVVHVNVIGPLGPDDESFQSCRQPRCVNPAHLRGYYKLDNPARANDLPVKNRVKAECPAGHPFHGENLYIDPRGARGCKTCRRQQFIASQARRRLRSH